jgi:hypothetical protein
VVTDDRLALAELADAARECPAMSDARVLANWIGAGRELTASGVLKPADAVEVCERLGIELPTKRPRSALDIDELMMVWATADNAGFIEVADRRVTAGEGLRQWQRADADNTVAIWTRCVLESLGLTGAPDEEPGMECLAVLCAMYTGENTVGLADLAASVAEFPSGTAPTEDGWCPDCGQVHAEDVGPLGMPGLFDSDPDGVDLVQDALLALAEFGVVTLDDDTAALAPLGRWLTNYMFRDSAPPADADTATLVAALAGLPPVVAALMARPWLNARTPTAAADQLLTLAESAAGSTRITALALAEECGPQAAPAWREWSGKPGFGAYARAWLAGDGGGDLSESDEAWLIVDALASMLDALPAELPEPLLSVMLAEQVADEIAEVLPVLASSGHPAAGRLAALLTGTTATPGPLPAADSVHQIKITLRGVSKPPVWRRVQVPADIRLDQLHDVIQKAMGWDDGHLHVFSTGWADYGLPDPELGHGDERTVRLSELLNGIGDKLRYTYDFGDDWEHDVLLEKVLRADPGTPYPVCTAGKGACPPEDCGGVGGYASLKETLAGPDDEEQREMLEWLGLDSAADFDPTEFSVEETRVRLASLPVRHR